MEKGSVVKKVVCYAVCVVLLIIALVFSGKTSGVTAGKGRGTDAKITSLEQFADVFSKLSQTSAVAVADGKSTVADGKKEKEYTSFTMHETSRISVSSSSSFSNSSSQGSSRSYRSNDTVINRTLDYYYTEEAVYYSAEMVFTTTSVYRQGYEEEDKVTTSVSLNMELYLGEDYALLKFNRFLWSATDQDSIGTDNIIGKWFKFEEGDRFVSSLISVNNYNFRFLGLLSDCLESYCDKGFEKSGGVYTLSDSAFNSFVNSVLSIYGASSGSGDDITGDLTVNIEDATKPQVILSMKEDYKYSDQDHIYSVEVKAKQGDVLEFSNINNTVINIPKNIKTYTIEDLQELIGD